MVRNVACFITGGYTEAGYIQFFLEKINPDLVFHQKLPNKPKRKRIQDLGSKAEGKVEEQGLIKDEFNGITGESLIDKICEVLSMGSVQREIAAGAIDAILIEDDTDARFYGKDQNFIENQERLVRKRLEKIVHKSLPVIFLYASPEVESWFISDWGNGLGWLYSESEAIRHLDAKERQYYSVELHRLILTDVLHNHPETIEDYGYDENGTYTKLSSRLIDIVQKEVKDRIRCDTKANPRYVKDIMDSRELYYSKKRHGSMMMKHIEPDIVAATCRKYFIKGYFALKDINRLEDMMP